MGRPGRPPGCRGCSRPTPRREGRVRGPHGDLDRAPPAAPGDRPSVRGPRRAVPSGRGGLARGDRGRRSEEHTSELQSREKLVCRLLLEKKKKKSCGWCVRKEETKKV